MKTKSVSTKIDLLTLQGVVLQTITLNSIGLQHVNINQLPDGIYLVRITSNGIQKTEKLFVQ